MFFAGFLLKKKSLIDFSKLFRKRGIIQKKAYSFSHNFLLKFRAVKQLFLLRR